MSFTPLLLGCLACLCPPAYRRCEYTVKSFICNNSLQIYKLINLHTQLECGSPALPPPHLPQPRPPFQPTSLHPVYTYTSFISTSVDPQLFRSPPTPRLSPVPGTWKDTGFRGRQTQVQTQVCHFLNMRP